MQEINKIIDELKGRCGLDSSQILEALQQMLSPQDLDKAKKILGERDEREEAEKMFGLKFL